MLSSLHLRRHRRAGPLDDLLGLPAGELLRLHDLAHAHVERLQLEQQEQPLEDRDVELLLEVELVPPAPLVALGRGAAVEDQHLLEGIEVDVQVEVVGGFARQDQLHIARIDADVVRLLEDARHALNDALLHDEALVRSERARHQQVAVGAEGLVGLLEPVQLSVVLLAPPVIEVAEEAACLLRLAAGPRVCHRQAVEQGKPRDGDEALAATLALGLDGVEAGDFRSGGRGWPLRAAWLAELEVAGKKPALAVASCASAEGMISAPHNAARHVRRCPPCNPQSSRRVSSGSSRAHPSGCRDYANDRAAF